MAQRDPKVTAMGTTPRIKVYRVAAVFEIEMSEFDSGIVFMPLSEAQPFFNLSGNVTGIEVYTTKPDRRVPQGRDRVRRTPDFHG